MNSHELAVAMIDAKHLLEQALSLHEERCQVAAESDRDMRLAKSTALLATAGTVQERQARMDKATADEQYAAKLAEDLKQASLEGIRSRRQILSALQSLAAAQREEAALARWEPNETSVA